MTVFDKTWFELNQSKLKFACKSKWFRDVIGLDDYDKDMIIVPNGIHIPDYNNKYTFISYTHDKYAKRLYYRLKPLWWTLHGLDWLFLDRQKLIPSFGFDTLTSYPDPSPETDTADGFMAKSDSGLNYATAWANAQGSATSDSANSSSSPATVVQVKITNTADVIYQVEIIRGMFTFDTSSLTSSASISAATYSLYAMSTSTSVGGSLNIYSASPGSDNKVQVGDYDSLGTTAFATAINFSSLSTGAYNNWTLNATGLAGISKTGITALGLRQATNDAANSAPGDPGTDKNIEDSVMALMAENADVTSDPKLVIVYSYVNPKKRIIVVQ